MIKISLPGSITSGADGPISIAAAPAPPVHRALPFAYTAMSPQTTSAYLPLKTKEVDRNNAVQQVITD